MNARIESNYINALVWSEEVALILFYNVALLQSWEAEENFLCRLNWHLYTQLVNKTYEDAKHLRIWNMYHKCCGIVVRHKADKSEGGRPFVPTGNKIGRRDIDKYIARAKKAARAVERRAAFEERNNARLALIKAKQTKKQENADKHVSMTNAEKAAAKKRRALGKKRRTKPATPWQQKLVRAKEIQANSRVRTPKVYVAPEGSLKQEPRRKVQAQVVDGIRHNLLSEAVVPHAAVVRPAIGSRTVVERPVLATEKVSSAPKASIQKPVLSTSRVTARERAAINFAEKQERALARMSEENLASIPSISTTSDVVKPTEEESFISTRVWKKVGTSIVESNPTGRLAYAEFSTPSWEVEFAVLKAKFAEHVEESGLVLDGSSK